MKRLEGLLAGGEMDADLRDRALSCSARCKQKRGNRRLLPGSKQRGCKARMPGWRTARQERSSSCMRSFREDGMDLTALEPEEAARQVRLRAVGPQS